MSASATEGARMGCECELGSLVSGVPGVLRAASGIIERCDLCEVYADDLAAAVALAPSVALLRCPVCTFVAVRDVRKTGPLRCTDCGNGTMRVIASGHDERLLRGTLMQEVE